MRDRRSRRVVVVEGRSTRGRPVRDYVARGYGVILIPDLSALSERASDRFLATMADHISEFARDGERVVVLKRRTGRWTKILLGKLSRRKLPVDVREIR